MQYVTLCGHTRIVRGGVAVETRMAMFQHPSKYMSHALPYIPPSRAQQSSSFFDPLHNVAYVVFAAADPTGTTAATAGDTDASAEGGNGTDAANAVAADDLRKQRIASEEALAAAEANLKKVLTERKLAEDEREVHLRYDGIPCRSLMSAKTTR